MEGQEKIEEIFAYIAVDTDGTEGIMGAPFGEGIMPLIGADMARADSLRPLAEAVRDEAGLPEGSITLAHFRVREDMETF